MDLPEYKRKYPGDYDYLICSVRKATKEEKEEIQIYLKEARKDGTQILYPEEDTNQEDPTGGYRICRDHSQEIYDAKRFRIIWNPNSTGSHVDLGAILLEHFIRGKPIKIVNKRRVEKIAESQKKQGLSKTYEMAMLRAHENSIDFF